MFLDRTGSKLLMARRNMADQGRARRSSESETSEVRGNYGWLVAACFIFGGAGILAILILNEVLKHNPEERHSGILLWAIIVGVLMVGVGQLVSIASHGMRSKRSAGRIDGVGKCTALAGWSVGLMPTIGLTGMGTSADSVKVAMFVAIVLVIGTGIGVVALMLRVNRWRDRR